MTDKPLVSVIVPIYKVEKYLCECVDSIISQSYSNLEIILVDDGSPDKCPEICDEYAQKDSRIKVIHKPNGGLSDARNAGIEVAKGEYLSFVDSDDVIHSQMIEVLMEPILEDRGLKMSACSFKKFDDGEEIGYEGGKYPLNIVSAKSYMSIDMYVVAWGKIYAKELFSVIQFPKGRIHEDEFTTYKLVYYAEKIAYVKSPYYFYRQRNDSIMSKTSVRRMTDKFIALWERLDFFEKEGVTDLLGISIKEFLWQHLENKAIVEKRINEIIDKCSFKDLSMYDRLKIKLKTWFPFLVGIKKKLKN